MCDYYPESNIQGVLSLSLVTYPYKDVQYRKFYKQNRLLNLIFDLLTVDSLPSLLECENLERNRGLVTICVLSVNYLTV